MNEKKIFIQANDKQYFGALLARYAIDRFQPDGERIPIQIINTDDLPTFQALHGKRYWLNRRRRYEKREFSLQDLQSFTLSRFMPPQLMQYQGRSLVIDPDVFALKDPRPIFDFDLKGASIAAVTNARGKPASSVMFMDCSKLKHWKIERILENLFSGVIVYRELMALQGESVTALPDEWNHHDKLEPETRMLHCTAKLTQPWKTGLPIDFRLRDKRVRLLNTLPSSWAQWLRPVLRVPLKFQPHPIKLIEQTVLGLVAAALQDGSISEATVVKHIEAGHVRSDLLTKVRNQSNYG